MELQACEGSHSSCSTPYHPSDLLAAFTFQQFIDVLSAYDYNSAQNLRRVLAIYTFPDEYKSFFHHTKSSPIPPFISSLSATFRRLVDLQSSNTSSHPSQTPNLSEFLNWLRPRYSLQIKHNSTPNPTYTLCIQRLDKIQQDAELPISDGDDEELRHWISEGLPGLPLGDLSVHLGSHRNGQICATQGVEGAIQETIPPRNVCVRGGLSLDPRKAHPKARKRRRLDDSEEEPSHLGAEQGLSKGIPEKQALSDTGLQFLLQLASSLRRTTTGDLNMQMMDIFDAIVGKSGSGSGISMGVDSLSSLAERCHKLDSTIMTLDFIHMVNCILLRNKINR